MFKIELYDNDAYILADIRKYLGNRKKRFENNILYLYDERFDDYQFFAKYNLIIERIV